MGWVFLLLGVLAEATSHVALKATNGFTNPLPSAIVILGHLTAFLFLGQAMKNLPVGIVHASWAGLAIVLVTLMSNIIYKQHLDAKVWLGMVVIGIGIAIINLSSVPHTH
ncbi:QacE family quaternary ammonium compound efflux SMR transporter [Photobacterium profundum]|uniref:Multidrug efflux transporter n=1 Tax=Photobacterium profundum 3TCK TaxID=314280 RepID=Q1Z616_9GAMM|nr:multidrug efflux SMR transporter [Photobacterium profundum]EAS44028.1 multidrug efflux transporter [Photobacterium profundum 3TCK]PSV61782.1 QacE family quaternary ammonium compound efflux SMR transporter [Photobacterium profundum]